MTTVVRKDEFIRAKKAMVDNLTGSRGDVILQGVLYKYQPDGAGYLVNSSDLAASSQLPFILSFPFSCCPLSVCQPLGQGPARPRPPAPLASEAA